MRLLALSPALPTPYEGGVLQLYHVLERLHRDYGYQITLISLDEQPPRPGPRPEELRFCDRVETVAVPRSGTRAKWLYGLRAFLSPRHLLGRRHTYLNPAYSPEMQRRVDRALADDPCDVLLAHNLYTAFYGWDAPVPKVAYVDCPFPELWRRSLASTSAANPLRKLYALLAYRAILRETRRIAETGYHALITTGPQDIPVWRRYLPQLRIEVIPNGVDTDYFAGGTAKCDRPTLVFTGTMSSPANVDAAIHLCRAVLPLVRREVPDVALSIVGSGPPPEVQVLAIDPAVTVTGFVPDVRPYLERAWVAVVPTTVGFGSPNKVLEALAMGKALVTTSAMAASFEAEAGVHLAIGDDVPAFAAQVVALLRDADRRRALGDAGRALVRERYTWARTTAAVDGLLREAVAWSR